MNRRWFLKSLICALLFIKQRSADEGHNVYVPLVTRFTDCIPVAGTPFRLDISTLDSGHLLTC